MSAKVTHVDTTFGGKACQFQIERDKLVGFEVAAGQPAYSLFTKLAANQWTVRDLEVVLGYALIDWSAPEAKMGRLTLDMLRLSMGPFHSSALMGVPPHFEAQVRKVFQQYGPARYAPLALMILEGALFGIDSSENVFDENVFDGAA